MGCIEASRLSIHTLCYDILFGHTGLFIDVAIQFIHKTVQCYQNSNSDALCMAIKLILYVLQVFNGRQEAVGHLI